MQIAALGPQDQYLTVDPEITFFKTKLRRHTNFAVESVEETFNGTITKGGRITATISRHGDLVHRMWLEIQCEPGGADLESALAYDCIETATLDIGGTRIDRHYGDWMRIWDELTTPDGKREHLDDFVKGTAASGQLLRVPLSFWFCRDPGQALPLVALQYHQVKLTVTFTDQLPAGAKVALWVDHIYLDVDERRRFAKGEHEYLIEQLQTTNEETIGTSAGKVRLDFNHPVKELVWTARGMARAKLQLRGVDRIAERDADYFERVQTYQHHTAPSDGVFVYSFALHPERLQPSGTCNFSRIDNAELQLAGTGMSTTTVYATNYNVLRIRNGKGGLVFSN